MPKLPITRAKLAGKRRMAIYTHDLADYSGLPLSILINELNASELDRTWTIFIIHARIVLPLV